MRSGIWILVIFFIVIGLGVGAKLYWPTAWEWFGVIDTASAVALALLALFGYVEYIRMEEKIEIAFDLNGQKIDTGLSLLRKNFTRSELLGVLGMIQKEQEKRFKLSFFQEPASLDAIQQIQKGKAKEFHIPLQPHEIEQFWIKR